MDVMFIHPTKIGTNRSMDESLIIEYGTSYVGTAHVRDTPRDQFNAKGLAICRTHVVCNVLGRGWRINGARRPKKGHIGIY